MMSLDGAYSWGMGNKNTRLLISSLVSDFVPEAGIEPARPKWAQDFKSGASTYSATQALILSLQKFPTFIGIWAENETRTRDPDLGKVVLYQLSYFRVVVWWCKDTQNIIPRKYFLNFF